MILGKASFRDIEYFAHLVQFIDGKKAIVLHPEEELYQSPDTVRVTVNIDDLRENEVAIRDYDYYSGLYNELVSKGIIEPTNKTIQSGFVEFPIGIIKE